MARRLLPVVAIVLLIATGARLYRIDAPSLWNDEGNSLRLAERTASDLIDAAGRDIHPPGYYLTLKAWITLAGTSELSLRLPSAFAGVLTVAAVIALGRRLFGAEAGALAGLMAALSPLAVYYGQETRMYALLGLCAALSMAVFVEWLARVERNRAAWGWALALALVNAAGLYTHYAYPFTVLAQGVMFALWLVWRGRLGAWRRALMVYVALNLLALALFAPWLPTAWDQLTTWPAAQAGIPLVERLRASLSAITAGGTVRDLPWRALIAPGLLAFGVLLGGARSSRELPRGWRALLPPAWIAATVGGLMLSGAYRPANLKFLVPASAAAELWMAGGSAGWWIALRRHGRMWGVIPLVLIGLVLAAQLRTLDALYHDPAAARDDYRAIAAQVARDVRPGDAIILDAPNQIEVFSYYYDGRAPVYGLPRGLGGNDAQTAVEVAALLARHERIFVLFWRADAPLPERYKVSAQLLAPDGTLIAQHDAEPNNNRAPTSGWQPGETVVDPHGLALPPGSAPGEYTVAIGVYPIDAPGERLRPGEPSPDNLLRLAPVRVEKMD